MAKKSKKSESKTKKKLQEEVRESANKIWLAGLGAFRVAEQEGSKLFNTLVEEGERFSKKTGEEVGKATSKARTAGEKVRTEAKEGWSRIEKGLDQAVAETLRTMGVPTRSEVEELSQRIEELTRAVDRLRSTGATEAKPAAKKAPARKPAAKKAPAKKAATRSKAGAKKAPAAKKPAPKKKSTSAKTTSKPSGRS